MAEEQFTEQDRRHFTVNGEQWSVYSADKQLFMSSIAMKSEVVFLMMSALQAPPDQMVKTREYAQSLGKDYEVAVGVMDVLIAAKAQFQGDDAIIACRLWATAHQAMRRPIEANLSSLLAT